MARYSKDTGLFNVEAARGAFWGVVREVRPQIWRDLCEARDVLVCEGDSPRYRSALVDWGRRWRLPRGWCRSLADDLILANSPFGDTADNIIDVHGARWADLDLDAEIWRLPRVDGRPPRELPMAPALVEELRGMERSGERVDNGYKCGPFVAIPASPSELSFTGDGSAIMPDGAPLAPEGRGLDGTPGFLLWLQLADLRDLREVFKCSDLWQWSGEEPRTGGKMQLKDTVRKRLKNGCSKLVTAYLRDVERWTAGEHFSFPRDFEWTVRRVVPEEPRGAAEKWEDIMPGAREDDDPDDNTGESAVRKAVNKLAQFIDLPLP